MGLFEFVKDAGSSIFGGSKMDSAELESYLRKEFGSHVTSLKAAIHEGIVRLVGVCDSIATKEKVVLMAGNITGVEQVNDDFLRVKEVTEVMQKDGQAPVIPQVNAPEDEITVESAPPEEAVVSEFYTIKSGDTLGKIAKEFYGDSLKYTAIFEANKEVIKDPDKIYPGQQIRIPKVL